MTYEVKKHKLGKKLKIILQRKIIEEWGKNYRNIFTKYQIRNVIKILEVDGVLINIQICTSTGPGGQAGLHK